VTLFERGEVAAGSSGRAAGICYDAYADRRDVRVAQRAIDRFRTLAPSFRACPYVLLAREADQAAAIESLAGRMADRGVRVDLLDGDALAAAFPGLVAADAGVTADVQAAAVVRNAGLVDPPAFTAAMADRAREAGATVRTETPVSLDGPRSVVTAAGTETFDAVVVAAGPATGSLVAEAGVDLALACYRAQALVTDPLPVDPPTVFDATDHYYLRPWGEGVLFGDGVSTDIDPTDWDPTADEAFRQRGVECLEAALGVEATVDRAWAGLCTATPDRDPLVGPVAPGLFVATGWHGHGLMRAPAIAESLAAQVLGGDGISGFDPTRFDGDEQFDPVEGMRIAER
jgi:sarcosine oxidase subunit beta